MIILDTKVVSEPMRQDGHRGVHAWWMHVSAELVQPDAPSPWLTVRSLPSPQCMGLPWLRAILLPLSRLAGRLWKWWS